MATDELLLQPVAYYKGPFSSKFGIPRQSSLSPEIRGRIVFCQPFRVQEALRGLEGFSHIWLIWGFSANRPTRQAWQPTVRPPRLGGNTALGVWATRSPFRPNPLGLSSVVLEGVENGELLVRGADLMDGTPIYDIKPYVSYADSHPEAQCGFAAEAPEQKLAVVIPEDFPISADRRTALEQVLALDPRPAYHDNPNREYVMPFDGADVHFRVQDGVLLVTGLTSLRGTGKA